MGVFFGFCSKTGTTTQAPAEESTNPLEFIQFIRTLPAHRALTAETNQDSADIATLALYYQLVNARRFGRNPSTLDNAKFSPQSVSPAVVNRLTSEKQKVVEAKFHIQGLMAECFANIYQSLVTKAEYQLPLQSYGAFANDTNLTKAAKYIANASNTVGVVTAAKRVSIEGVIQSVLNQGRDLRAVETIKYINSQFYNVNYQSPYRATHPDPNYPGSGGGRYLHQYSSQLSRQLQASALMPRTLMLPSGTPAPNANNKNMLVLPTHFLPTSNYTNIACFLFGSYMRSHGFTDGNGRTVRCIFACAIIKSGVPFVAPSKLFEDRLTGINPTHEDRQWDAEFDRVQANNRFVDANI